MLVPWENIVGQSTTSSKPIMTKSIYLNYSITKSRLTQQNPLLIAQPKPCPPTSNPCCNYFKPWSNSDVCTTQKDFVVEDLPQSNLGYVPIKESFPQEPTPIHKTDPLHH